MDTDLTPRQVYPPTRSLNGNAVFSRVTAVSCLHLGHTRRTPPLPHLPQNISLLAPNMSFTSYVATLSRASGLMSTVEGMATGLHALNFSVVPMSWWGRTLALLGGVNGAKLGLESNATLAEEYDGWLVGPPGRLRSGLLGARGSGAGWGQSCCVREQGLRQGVPGRHVACLGKTTRVSRPDVEAGHGTQEPAHCIVFASFWGALGSP